MHQVKLSGLYSEALNLAKLVEDTSLREFVNGFVTLKCTAHLLNQVQISRWAKPKVSLCLKEWALNFSFWWSRIGVKTLRIAASSLHKWFKLLTGYDRSSTGYTCSLKLDNLWESAVRANLWAQKKSDPHLLGIQDRARSNWVMWYTWLADIMASCRGKSVVCSWNT